MSAMILSFPAKAPQSARGRWTHLDRQSLLAAVYSLSRHSVEFAYNDAGDEYAVIEGEHPEDGPSCYVVGRTWAGWFVITNWMTGETRGGRTMAEAAGLMRRMACSGVCAEVVHVT